MGLPKLHSPTACLRLGSEGLRMEDGEWAGAVTAA